MNSNTLQQLSIRGSRFAAASIAFGIIGLTQGSYGQATYSQVTGTTSDTANGNQAETMCNVSVVQGVQNVADGSSIEMVTYNDITPSAFIQFPNNDPSSRIVTPGASLMGWSYRIRTQSNSEPSWAHKSMNTPSGWAVLLGDPSLASNPSKPNFVFMGNLAMPQDKFDFVANLHNTPGSLVGEFGQNPSPVGGGCVARSTDGGQTFVLVGCMRDTSVVNSNSGNPVWATSDTFGHFYDGSSIAITSDPSTNVSSAFMAFDDTEIQREAVWIMPDIAANLTATGPFDAFQPDGVVGNVGALPDDSLGEIETHVRLRATASDLWKMSGMYRDAAVCSRATFHSQSQLTDFVPADLKINVRNRNGNAILLADDAVIAENVDFGAVVGGAELAMRTGPQFSFDLGTNEQGDFEMRYVYMAADSQPRLLDANNNCTSGSATGQNFRLKGGWCDANLNCHPVPEWSSPGFPDAMALFPAIKYALIPGSNKPTWKMTFQGRNPQDTSKVAIFAGDLVRQPNTQTASILSTSAVTNYQTPCPSFFSRDKMSSYWGDYDDMTFDPNTAGFIRSYVDSSLGCTSRGNLTSHEVHVSTVEISARPRLAVQVTGLGIGASCAVPEIVDVEAQIAGQSHQVNAFTGDWVPPGNDFDQFLLYNDVAVHRVWSVLSGLFSPDLNATFGGPITSGTGTVNVQIVLHERENQTCGGEVDRIRFNFEIDAATGNVAAVTAAGADSSGITVDSHPPTLLPPTGDPTKLEYCARTTIGPWGMCLQILTGS